MKDRDATELSLAQSLGEDGDDDDAAGEHEAAGFGHGVNAENLFEITDGESSEKGQANTAATTIQGGAADDDDGDSGEFVADTGFRVALLFLCGLAHTSDGCEEAAGGIGEDFREFDRQAGKASGFLVSADGVKVSSPIMAREREPGQSREQKKNDGDDREIASEDAAIDEIEEWGNGDVVVSSIGSFYNG